MPGDPAVWGASGKCNHWCLLWRLQEEGGRMAWSRAVGGNFLLPGCILTSSLPQHAAHWGSTDCLACCWTPAWPTPALEWIVLSSHEHLILCPMQGGLHIPRAWSSPACGPCTLLAIFLLVIELLCTGNTVVNKTDEFCALKEFNIPGVEDGQFLREAIDYFNWWHALFKKRIYNGIHIDWCRDFWK